MDTPDPAPTYLIGISPEEQEAEALARRIRELKFHIVGLDLNLLSRSHQLQRGDFIYSRFDMAFETMAAWGWVRVRLMMMRQFAAVAEHYANLDDVEQGDKACQKFYLTGKIDALGAAADFLEQNNVDAGLVGSIRSLVRTLEYERLAL